jgi:hypothetical protein
MEGENHENKRQKTNQDAADSDSSLGSKGTQQLSIDSMFPKKTLINQ